MSATCEGGGQARLCPPPESLNRGGNAEYVAYGQSSSLDGTEVSEFDWFYDMGETCYILEGEVEVKPTDGRKAVTFGPGDMVTFPKGLPCVWNVKKPVRKHYNFG